MDKVANEGEDERQRVLHTLRNSVLITCAQAFGWTIALRARLSRFPKQDVILFRVHLAFQSSPCHDSIKWGSQVHNGAGISCGIN